MVFDLQGRAIGIVIGCLLGMFPLYFMNKKPIGSTDETTETEATPKTAT